MKDPQIRNLLRVTELTDFLTDNHSKVVEELKLPVAKARIDIAVINGHLHGYEIKSASDTLQRLPGQIEAYSKVFDFVTIVTENKYHERILEAIPNWIGVSICSNENDKIKYTVVQPARQNLNKDGFFVAQLLWRSELIEILNEQNISFKKKLRTWLLCELASAQIDISVLSDLVRAKLKARENWKLKQTIH